MTTTLVFLAKLIGSLLVLSFFNGLVMLIIEIFTDTPPNISPRMVVAGWFIMVPIVCVFAAIAAGVIVLIWKGSA